MVFESQEIMSYNKDDSLEQYLTTSGGKTYNCFFFFLGGGLGGKFCFCFFGGGGDGGQIWAKWAKIGSKIRSFAILSSLNH